jgi:hypothetical protein
MAFARADAQNAALEPTAFYIFTPTAPEKPQEKIKPGTAVPGPISPVN